MTLAALALRDGDKTTAIEHLRRASEAPASEELAYSDAVIADWRSLVRRLLAQNERPAVIEFLERMARINIAERLDLRQAADSLRRGENPEWLS
jgi:hypothetical protein